MKRFCLKSGAFLLLQLALFALLWNPDVPYDRNYLAASIDKHHRLKSTPSPRVILVGGSNLAFGMKTKTLEEELGVPVVNMGLNFHLGVPFILDDIASAIRPGDVVVLSLEYGGLASPGDDLILAEMFELRPASLLLLPPSRSKDFIERHGLSILGGIARRAVLTRFRSSSEVVAGSSKPRNFFDEYGTFIGHYGLAGKGYFKKEKVLAMSGEIHAKIESFVRLCRARNALCLYTCPPQPIPLITPLPTEVQHNHDRLEKVEGLTFLDSPLDHAYEIDLFFDSAYHLTEEGALQRTRKLAAQLRPYLMRHVSSKESTRSISADKAL